MRTASVWPPPLGEPPAAGTGGGASSVSLAVHFADGRLLLASSVTGLWRQPAAGVAAFRVDVEDALGAAALCPQGAPQEDDITIVLVKREAGA